MNIFIVLAESENNEQLKEETEPMATITVSEKTALTRQIQEHC